MAELLEHESLKSRFCTWEIWIPGLFAWVAKPPHTVHFITALFACQQVSTLLPPCTHLPIYVLSSSDPQDSEFQASIQCNNSDLATNKCFSLLLEFKENSLQNFGEKKPIKNNQNPLVYIYIHTFMSEDCWNWRSIWCQVACPSFCQQNQHIHLGLGDRLTRMLRYLSRDVTCCDWGKKKSPQKHRVKINYKNDISGVSVFIPTLKTITLWQIFKFCLFDSAAHKPGENKHEREQTDIPDAELDWHLEESVPNLTSKCHMHVITQKWIRYYL